MRQGGAVKFVRLKARPAEGGPPGGPPASRRGRGPGRNPGEAGEISGSVKERSEYILSVSGVHYKCFTSYMHE